MNLCIEMVSRIPIRLWSHVQDGVPKHIIGGGIQDKIQMERGFHHTRYVVAQDVLHGRTVHRVIEL